MNIPTVVQPVDRIYLNPDQRVNYVRLVEELRQIQREMQALKDKIEALEEKIKNL